MKPFRLALAMAICTVPLTAANAQTGAPEIETIASYPHGQFLENLDMAAGGSVIVTSYVDQRLLRWPGSGEVETFAQLDVHPVGVLAQPGRIIVSAHGASFTGGPDFTKTNQLLVLDPDGVLQRRVMAPQALFLNGMTALDEDHILIADSLAGMIWLFRPSSGEILPWLEHPLLAVAAPTDQRPGANGLKMRDGALYVSNSSRGAIYRVRLDGLEPAGEVEQFARTGPVDDFTYLPDGAIAAATHGERLIRVDPDGTVSDIMREGCDACTSVMLATDRSLLVTTSGNLLEGGDAPARLLRIPPSSHPGSGEQ
ncbi:SMP-30/gluconolactonase/LRE family protein [Qipengyuania qiaonensis]|uniref:SMP-30/Gluconolactonase/LRE-like region domain-containing protein n=1 Tax=Qipengyuania qiaonensis TaxID=2867240 RepID=A0ABS7J2W9_9SPHN|nr:hypothetical protein [Qipengyuania qiaonensis]MBX7481607.1 hypothetical protein [Qipengyuania qiaonensis]